jgi:excisionase family DNA binding protein
MVDHYLTVKQVAALMAVQPSTVRAWLRDGRIIGARVGKDWRIPSTALPAQPSGAILDRLAARLAALPPDRLAKLAEALGDESP